MEEHTARDRHTGKLVDLGVHEWEGNEFEELVDGVVDAADIFEENILGRIAVDLVSCCCSSSCQLL